jgi:hypothetical protein
MADARSQVLSGALGQFNQQELDAFDALANSVSTVIGLRSLTKASASNTSAKALENDIPIIGINTVNSHEFYNKMAKLATLVQNGSKGILPGALPKEESARYENLPSQIAKLATGGAVPSQTAKVSGLTLEYPDNKGAMQKKTFKTQAELDKVKKAIEAAGHKVQ